MANFASVSKAVFLLALLVALACESVRGSAQHTCAYPQACTNPGAPDPGHTVTTAARYDPTTKKCVAISPPVTGPHNCQQFASIADCEKSCGSA